MAKRVTFATTNEYKFKLAKSFTEEDSHGEIELIRYISEVPEVQHSSEEEIARQSAIWVSKRLGETAVASDVGFRIAALNGFPGPFVKFVNQWLTPKNIIDMVEDVGNRDAYFINALACATPDDESATFVSVTPGHIAPTTSRQGTGKTIDSIFIPEGHNAALIDLPEEARDQVWDSKPWADIMTFLDDKS